MGEPHVISALVAKRAELAGLALFAGNAKASAIAVQIEHVDHMLILFGYRGNPRDIPAKRKHIYRFKRNELPRPIRQIGADGVKRSNRDVASAMITLKGWDATDRKLKRVAINWPHIRQL